MKFFNLLAATALAAAPPAANAGAAQRSRKNGVGFSNSTRRVRSSGADTPTALKSLIVPSLKARAFFT